MHASDIQDELSQRLELHLENVKEDKLEIDSQLAEINLALDRTQQFLRFKAEVNDQQLVELQDYMSKQNLTQDDVIEMIENYEPSQKKQKLSTEKTEETSDLD